MSWIPEVRDLISCFGRYELIQSIDYKKICLKES